MELPYKHECALEPGSELVLDLYEPPETNPLEELVVDLLEVVDLVTPQASLHSPILFLYHVEVEVVLEGTKEVSDLVTDV